ncbi:MAG: glycosyltransferase family 2 protein [Pleurocapsa minor HA4230-MV1]|jgi:glycosyltransferase involved in cell wall biosynthesis|nr:glycosyltransferase family 2 protein [Pleurocapsa minor HA4230-MV1]
MPKVSVVIPAYNAMAYLPETIANVLKQTYTDFEVVVINDGSTDKIEEWITQEVSDRQVKLISQANLGATAARNTGISESQGEYLAFLDADDLWESTKLAKQVEVLDSHPEVGLVYTWVTYINEQGNSTGRVVNHQQEGDVWQELTKGNLIECGSVPMVRRECFEKCGVFDCNLGSFVEDWDIWLRIANYYQFKVVKESLVYYRQVPNSGSRNWQAMAKGYQLVIEKAFATAAWEDLFLRNKSYGTANLVVGWKALQCQTKDYQQASYFRSQALRHDPWLFFSKEYFRLSIAIALMSWFGANGYQRFLSFFYALRRGTRNVFSVSR